MRNASLAWVPYFLCFRLKSHLLFYMFSYLSPPIRSRLSSQGVSRIYVTGVFFRFEKEIDDLPSCLMICPGEIYTQNVINPA